MIDFIDNNNKFITFFQVSIERLYNYNTFCCIDQKNEYQVFKSQTNYRKFNNYKASNVLINYKEKHIYKIIIEKNKIKQYFNVK